MDQQKTARTVHDAVTRWAGQTPDAPAVTCADGTLTYRDLDERANRLAHHLRRLGVQRDVVVAIHLDRGLDHYVALLGVFRAGGAVLPLDPGYPDARLRYMLQDSDAQVLLTRTAPPAAVDCTVVRLDTVAAQLAGLPTTAPAEPAGRDDLAYLMYTSASTGPPKGVQLEHGGIADLCDWHVAALGLTATDRGSLAAPLSFDASILDLWPVWSVGGHAIAISDEDRGDPDNLVRALRENRVTVCFLTTALAEIFLAQPDLETLSLRYLVTGGEALRRRPRPGLPFRLINIYGPTETTVYVTSAVVADSASDDGPIPIGRPLGEIEVRLLDPHGRPVPDGDTGEIVVAGSGVARGYRGRADLTAQRFGVAAGRRTYRTGDLARRRPDGALEFVGRIDRQVKIRGHRIEPDEIERVLLEQPGVRQAAVAAVRPSPDTAQLVAYVEPDPTAGTGGWSSPSRPAGSDAATVARIRALAPESLLEVGPGVPGLGEACGSHTRLDSVAGLAAPPRTGFAAVLIDAHAPGLDSLADVLAAVERAVRLTADGGTVVVSGIRSLALLPALHCAAELATAPDDTTGAELRWRTYARLRADTAPAIHPAAFAGPATHVVPRFDRDGPGRYDVLVHVGETPPAPQVDWLDWTGDRLDLGVLRARLRTGTHQVLAVRGIPDAQAAMRFTAWTGAAGETTAGALKLHLRPAAGVPSLIDLPALTIGLPYRVRLSWAAGRPDGSVDAVWLHDCVPEPATIPWPGPQTVPDVLATGGAADGRDDDLRVRLRQALAARLAPYEMPDVYVVLDRLPLTPVGKVDRPALPPPHWLGGERPSSAAPRTPVEQAVTALAEEVLGRAGTGRDDDLRSLGAHSLTLAQLSARIVRQFGVRVPVRELLAAPTVASIAQRIEGSADRYEVV